MRNAMTRSLAHLVLASVILVACADRATNAQQKIFQLSSTTFKDGQMLPVKAANSRANDPQNPNCVGENISPQLSWINPPAGTKSFAFLMIDPEGRGGAGVNHWVAYGIPSDITGFAEGEVSKESAKYVGGKSRQGVGRYSGPCTPRNVQPRHYVFVLIATDLEPNALPPSLTKDDLTAKIVPSGSEPRHDKGSAGLVGLFAHPGN